MAPRKPKPKHHAANPRRVALEAVSRALQGKAFAQDSLESAATSAGLAERDLRLAAEITYGVVRRMATLDAILAAFSSRKLAKLDLAIHQILRIGAYQAVFMDKVPAHAVVNESVRLARSTGHAAASGFVNAVLRQILRAAGQVTQRPSAPEHCVPTTDQRWLRFTRPVLPSASRRAQHLAAAYSYPEWIVRRWIDQHGEDNAVELLRLGNRSPALFLRPNAQRTTAKDLAASLAAQEIDARPTASGRTLRLPHGVNPATLPDFRLGHLQVQDDSAAAVAPFMQPRSGESILDLCAAPGGKTCHLADLMANQGHIIAVDVSTAKLRRVSENIQRMGFTIVECVESDGAAYTASVEDRFDGVLVDAPCTNSGVLHRRAEARWRLGPKSLGELTRRQTALLAAASKALKPGGRMVYSTCSLEPEENGDMARACASTTGLVLEEELQIMPSEDGDGTYMARLRKPAEGSTQ